MKFWHFYSVLGPYLIVAPLSTIPNWESEFKRFAPKIPVVAITGSAEDRRANLPNIKRKYRVGTSDFFTAPVVLVTYQTPLLEAHSLAAISWKWIIIVLITNYLINPYKFLDIL